MGAVAWLAVGLMIALIIRGIAKAKGWPRGWPPITFGVVGAVLGGFIFDLFLRGDGVVAVRAPSLLGSAVGAAVLLAVAYAIGWTNSPRRGPASPEVR